MVSRSIQIGQLAGGGITPARGDADPEDPWLGRHSYLNVLHGCNGQQKPAGIVRHLLDGWGRRAPPFYKINASVTNVPTLPAAAPRKASSRSHPHFAVIW